MSRRSAYFGIAAETAWAYSQATEAAGLVHVAGQVPRDLDGNVLGETLADKLGGAADNLEVALGLVGATAADLVYTQTHVAAGDRATIDVAVASHRERFGAAASAATVVPVAGLNHPNYRIEVSAVAVAGRDARSMQMPDKQAVFTGSPSEAALGSAAAVRAAGLVYVSGQPSVGGDGAVAADASIAAHYERALDGFLTVVERAGATAADVVSLTILVTEPLDAAAFERVSALHGDRFGAGDDRPANTMLIVPELSVAGARVEIAGVAVAEA